MVPNVMSELTGKTVLVTGANRGIGRALADRFLALGATTLLTARSAAARETLARDFASAGDRVRVFGCDIADPDSVRALQTGVASAVPQLDILVNNAGVFVKTDRLMYADDVDPRVLEETLRTNLFGTIAMCAAFIPSIPAGGRIINVSSTMGQLSDGGLEPYAVAYSVSKAALNAYTSALANRLRERRILADAVHPGWVQTDMGGPGAQISPEAGTETIVFLATRPVGATGKFWNQKQIVDW
jgi:NAD(P)-dependent dehydrogenase (short-subunit alcohol dehydrogenase family)